MFGASWASWASCRAVPGTARHVLGQTSRVNGAQPHHDVALPVEDPVPMLPLDLGPAVSPRSALTTQTLGAGDRVARVLIDEPAIDRVFDYLVPAKWADSVRVGSIVRVDLRGRRVRGWVTELDVDPPAGVGLRPITKITGLGPPPGIIALARWAAERWVGRVVQLMRVASPPTAVSAVTSRDRTLAMPVDNELVDAALAEAVSVVRLAPNGDEMPLVVAAAARGRTLVLVPSVSAARHMALRLRRAGVPSALMPRDWSQSAGGAVTVGTRAAAFAPIGPLDAVVVLDEHDESYQEESAPTWNARDVAIERARRDGAPCMLVSPAPSLEALDAGTLLRFSRSDERAGWPVVDVVDRRADDPATGEWCSDRLARLLGSDQSVACVINRKGRARIAVCNQCGELPRGASGRALALTADSLVDVETGATRPIVCERCGSMRFRRLRLGVKGVSEELEAMARRPVAEVTSETDGYDRDATLFVGTEAMLHRLDHVDVVVFLDFDQELLAPRYRAAEQALTLLVRAARLVGPRSGDGRIVIQTRLPDHDVIDAARHGDPGRMTEAERDRRRDLNLAPYRAMALISGAAAPEFMDALSRTELSVMGPDDGKWLITAVTHDTLTRALNDVPRPRGRLRIEVDPLRA